MDSLIETRERLVRLETKMDAALTEIKKISVRQDECPARRAYLAQEVNVKRERRFLGLAGWALALLSTMATLFNAWLSNRSGS